MTKQERRKRLDEAIEKIQKIANDYNITVEGENVHDVFVIHHGEPEDPYLGKSLTTVPF